MKIIKKDLGPDFQEIQIKLLADLHIGDATFDEKLLDIEIKEILETPNMFTILNGDLINNAIVGSPSDIYGEVYNPEEQLDILIKKFSPIKHKILGVSQGNHEFRTYRQTGIDVLKLFCVSLGIRDIYDAEGALLFVSFGKNKYREKIRHVVSIYFTHIGGSKARLVYMSDIVDADVYMRSHYHNVEIKKVDVFRTDKRYKTINRETKTFVQNGACMTYGGYGQMKGYAPGSSIFPVVVSSIVAIGNQEKVVVSVRT